MQIKKENAMNFGIREKFKKTTIGEILEAFKIAEHMGSIEIIGELAILLKTRNIDVAVDNFHIWQMEERLAQLQNKETEPKKGFRRREEIAVWKSILREIHPSSLAPNSSHNKFISERYRALIS